MGADPPYEDFSLLAARSCINWKCTLVLLSTHRISGLYSRLLWFARQLQTPPLCTTTARLRALCELFHVLPSSMVGFGLAGPLRCVKILLGAGRLKLNPRRQNEGRWRGTRTR